jgi:photosystem II stability/assembly factor-like uncharacterized protein
LGLAVQPRDGAVIYIDNPELWHTSEHTYLWRSSDNGRSWHRITLPGWQFETPRFDPSRPSVAVMKQGEGQDTTAAGHTARLWRSVDGGRTWRRQLRALPTEHRDGRTVPNYDDGEAGFI